MLSLILFDNSEFDGFIFKVWKRWQTMTGSFKIKQVEISGASFMNYKQAELFVPPRDF